MKKILILLLLVVSSFSSNAQLFDFAHTAYFETTDQEPDMGTLLTPSGNTLLNFNFNVAPVDHPLFNNGVYFPIYDCANHNLWLRVKHIATDPNGWGYGFSIEQSMNSPFLPAGSADRIGGWNGFLYDFQIFSDVSLDGNRMNELGAPYPIQIIVESLETLYNDGGSQFEWLSFEIFNPESDGWQLMATNFTGINPLSNPGFSAELNYSYPVDWGMAPEGFSTDFPNGSNTIYAVDLNLSSAYHSEFRMSAGAVSHFRYGYEFNSGGYQGMSMTFGGAPTIIGSITPQCGTDANGIISVSTTGPSPFVFDWGNGITGTLLDGLTSGTYNVTLTDGSGCISQASFDILEAIPVTATLEVIPSEDGVSLIIIPEGGSGEYTFEWSTGSFEDSIFVNSLGIYEFIVSSNNGCSFSASYEFLGTETVNSPHISLYPNPVGNFSSISGSPNTHYRVLGLDGRFIQNGNLDALGKGMIATSSWSKGLYLLQLIEKSGATYSMRFVVE